MADSRKDSGRKVHILVRVALFGILVYVAFLARLHFLRSDLDPTLSFVDEYLVGPWSGVMVSAQLALALGVLFLVVTLHVSDVAEWRSSPSSMLLIFALTALLGGLYRPDPVAESLLTEGPTALSASGWVHALSNVIGAVAVMLGMLALSIGLGSSRRLGRYRPILLVLSVLAPLAYLATLSIPAGSYPAGLYQRIFLGITMTWLTLCALGSATETDGREPSEARQVG